MIDEKYVGLVDQGFNVAIMSTFSCGNALPAIAKYSNLKIKTLGETSGGGACVLRSTMSDIGLSYVLSGLVEISVERNGAIVNVGKGVEPDVAIAQSSMFDRSVVSAKTIETFAKQ